MTLVLASTDQLPSLAQDLATRRAQRLDRFDEWWDGVYRVVTGPSPEHGMFAVELGALLLSLARQAGLHASAPVNIGVDKADCRVPDLGVFRPDTPRTSPAFLSTAELVVEILSPGEPPGLKLGFYGEVGVHEYLELNPRTGTVRLLRHDEAAGWEPVERSEVLGFAVEPGALVVGTTRLAVPTTAD